MPIIEKELDSKLATQIQDLQYFSKPSALIDAYSKFFFFKMIMDCNQWYKTEKALQLLPWSLESSLWMNHAVV